MKEDEHQGHRPSRVGLAVLVLAVLFVVLNAPLPASLSHSRLLGTLQNASHGLLFAGVAGLTLWLLGSHSWRSYLNSWLIAAGLALATELSQFLSSREPSWGDVRTDLMGATVALAAWALFRTRRTAPPGFRRAAMAGLGYAALSLILWPMLAPASVLLQRHQHFPVLFRADFASALTMTESMTADEDVAMAIRDGALQVRLLGGPLPGVVITDFAPDWRGYQALVMDVENPGALPLAIEVHMRDFGSSDRGNDRFNGRGTLPPGQRVSLSFPLTAVAQAPQGRTMRIDDMMVIALYRTEPGSDQIALHSIRLE